VERSLGDAKVGQNSSSGDGSLNVMSTLEIMIEEPSTKAP
jgi:hypothetical protein